jgi:hypothetical protein
VPGEIALQIARELVPPAVLSDEQLERVFARALGLADWIAEAERALTDGGIGEPIDWRVTAHDASDEQNAGEQRAIRRSEAIDEETEER